MKKTNFTDTAPKTGETGLQLDDGNRAIIAAMDPKTLTLTEQSLKRGIDAGDYSGFAQQLAVAMVEAIGDTLDAQHARVV